MKNELILLVPAAPAPAPDQAAARTRKSAGRPLRLGTLGNSKANADHLLRLLVDTVRADVPLESVVSLDKNNASVPGSSELLAQLASEADLVISAMAD